jgi:hypothetical protein
MQLIIQDVQKLIAKLSFEIQCFSFNKMLHV